MLKNIEIQVTIFISYKIKEEESLKVVILAGGYGTRISEESHLKPKPMIEIGEKPIIWHIMKEYSYYGFNEFVICAGYKQYIIKEWFANYFLHNSDITFDYKQGNNMIIHNANVEPWVVTVVDTGLGTMTGGRLKRIKKYIGNETFLMTYGDGVSDVNIREVVNYHKKHGKYATMTAVHPDGRFGVLDIVDDRICRFREKDRADVGWINAGYFVLEPEVLEYIDNDLTVFEREPLENLAKENQLMCYKHDGFWQCMDTLRDKQKLDELWEKNKAQWKKWEN